MQLLEYQAKEMLSLSGLPTPQSRTAQNISEATRDSLSFPLVIKSQVPVGGRGKLGGVRVVSDYDEFLTAFTEVKTLAIKGHTPDTLLLEEAIDIDRELYLALRLDRDERCIKWLVSNRGGIDIEENSTSVISLDTRDKTAYETISYTLSIDEKKLTPVLKNLEKCFVDNDLLLLEINPLVVTKEDTLYIADAKVLVDDNALFRHPAYAHQAVSSSVLPLGGTIGVIANGAGMAMSTMDTIYAAGGHPANFLDIGGGTGEDVFVKNLREITTLPGVTSIIVNIFAGISRCDDIARGIIAATKQIDGLVPLYIRLEGTNRDEAVTLLKEAGIAIEADLRTCVGKALKGEKGLLEDGYWKMAKKSSEIGVRSLEFGKRKSQASLAEQHGAIHPNGTKSEVQPELERPSGSGSPARNGTFGEVHYDARTSSDAANGVVRGDGERAVHSVLATHLVIIQGITGHHGSFHTEGMIKAGTHIVAGVTPGKAGQLVHDVPVYNTVAEAVSQHPATASVIFVPARFARAAMIEAIDAGIRLIVCITEGIPVHDMLAVKHYADDKNATIVGPNCPGLIVPGSHKLGIIAASITTPGSTAIVSRSGTLTYELAHALTARGIGQRIVLGIGGDPVQGTNFSEALQICQDDPRISQIVMIGEIGGTSEQIAADYAATHVTKPLYGLVVGHSLPAGQQFGHAGAIVGGHGESAAEKTEYMTAHGIRMFDTLDELISSVSA